MKFLTLPPELILKCIIRLSIQDVVHVAQSCSSLRALILSNKSAIYNTSNPETLRLPIGCTRDSISSGSLYAVAARAITISSHLSESSGLLEPRHISLYESTDPGFGENEQEIFMQDDIFAFRRIETIFIVRLADSKLSEIARLSLEPDAIYCVAYKISDAGNSLLVASSACRTSDESVGSVLSVREVFLIGRDVGKVVEHFEIIVPDGIWSQLRIRDPYLVLMSHWRLIMVNWRDGTGCALQLCGTATAAQDGSVPNLDCMEEVLIHPLKEWIVVFDFTEIQDNIIGIYSVHIPPATTMPLLNHDMSGMSHWTLIKGGCRTPLRVDRNVVDLYPIPLGFQSLHSPEPILSLTMLTLHDDTAIEPVDLNLLKNTTARFSHVVLNLSSDTTMQSTEPSGHYLGGPGTQFSVDYSRGYTVAELAVRTALDEYHVLAAKVDNGNGHRQCWVRLSIPKALRNSIASSSEAHGRVTERSMKPSSAFDIYTGRLYVRGPKGLLVLQY
ncbi:hypothetical protein SISNIDRAFT_455458 [Sistotremastrum niveocremeum HHB9708]|uniref:F-box domain-containing protein n=1 Tax=Sistotremastrum niveocremeum HHB9708 TaxID=1314777 RepID=A0A164U1H4_9AGAM|nr:hypothetical protein SISNIDRAFT_455458 [Sistotremastrum niveocremeum HHB9708]